MSISIIIPVYNEADNIAYLIQYLLLNGGKGVKEVVVVDGGSDDATPDLAKAAGAITLISPKKGRAAQMNHGASLASGDILYFVHADSFPPVTFVNDIRQAIADGYHFGRYRTRFNSKKAILKFNAFFTRFDLFVCYGGDQTLFVKKDLFIWAGGFDDTMRIMEDYEIVTRLKKAAKYKIIQKDTMVSARKYETNSWWKVQRANYTVVRMYKKGASQEAMVLKYRSMLDYR